jgi:hypothetical protein
MNVPSTSIGTVLYLSDQTPATYDEQGYEALTWQKAVWVKSIGALTGKWGVDSFVDLESGGTLTAKTTRDPGSTTIELGYVPSDFISIVKTGYLEKSSNYSFLIVTTQGEHIGFQGKIMSFTRGAFDGKFQTVSMDVSRQTDSDGNDEITYES